MDEVRSPCSGVIRPCSPHARDYGSRSRAQCVEKKLLSVESLPKKKEIQIAFPFFIPNKNPHQTSLTGVICIRGNVSTYVNLNSLLRGAQGVIVVSLVAEIGTSRVVRLQDLRSRCRGCVAQPLGSGIGWLRGVI